MKDIELESVNTILELTKLETVKRDTSHGDRVGLYSTSERELLVCNSFSEEDSSFTCRMVLVQPKMVEQVGLSEAPCKAVGNVRKIKAKIVIIILCKEGGSVGCIIFSSLRR